MTERQGLIQKAARYLSSARILVESGDIDSAVSRVYYATFFVAEALLDSLGMSFSSHKGVISAFGTEFSKKNRLDPRFHQLLITAFQKRQQADYWVETGLERSEVDDLLRDAHAFLHEAQVWLLENDQPK